ncbi:MAG TPA: hypothetical protein VKT31_02090 [Solirubrobacteraceae bacterium]|nr:hypothetical protein [Solirubrobacteraceae bacterium]
MADRMLFIGWGTPVRGREERGLEVFNEALGLYGRMQQDGRIEAFNVCLFDPNSNLNGFIELHASAEQLAAARNDDEFRRVMMDAALVVDDLHVIEGFTNEGIAREMARYQEAIAKVPQRA